MTTIKQSTAKTLVSYPSSLSTPSACAVVVYNFAGSQIASGAATVDAVSTTTSADAEIGETSLTLTSVTGVTVGKSYLLSAGGFVEPVIVLGINGSTVRIDHELPFSPDSGAAFAGYSVSYALTADETATIGGPYRVQWTYTISGVESVESTLYDVVSEADWMPTTAQDLAIYPSLVTYLAANSVDADTLLSRALATKMRPKLRSRGIKLDRVRDKSQLVPLHVAYAVLLVAEDKAMIDPVEQTQALDAAKSQAQDQLDMLLADLYWYDDSDDNVPSSGEVETDRKTTYLVM